MTYSQPGMGHRADKTERRFADLRSKLEQFGVDNFVNISIPAEKEFWDKVMTAINYCHDIEIAEQDQRMLYI